MYTASTTIIGTTALLQHRYSFPEQETLARGSARAATAADYRLEWIAGMYVDAEGYLIQPADHVLGAITSAASLFRIRGGRGKSLRDLARAAVGIEPEEIHHLRDGQLVRAPGPELLSSPTAHLGIYVKPVRVQRNLVPRARLRIAPGWTLSFRIVVGNDLLRPDDLQRILEEAGRSSGIGDWRPRFGKFAVAHFAVDAPDVVPPSPHHASA
jgi:hypothetical protein